MKEEGIQSDDRPLPRSQHVAVSLNDGSRVFVFGGHHTPKCRLNDTWIYQVPQKTWLRIGDEAENTENNASTIGAPDPRANMGSVFYEGKIYIQGGHGGLGFARRAYNDIFMFDPEELKWTKIETVSEKIPEGRGGHSLFASDGKLYIYGGWNQEQHYNSMWQFTLSNGEWFEIDLVFGMPRWNHTSVLVEAIPTWKFFIFGGESNEY